MSGPFVRAVTNAIDCGSDDWAFEYYMDGGRWPDSRETTFMESNKAWKGPEWETVVLLTMDMESGTTAGARVRDEVRRLP